MLPQEYGQSRSAAGVAASKTPTRLLPLDTLRKDGDTQGRILLDDQTIEDYTALMHEGLRFPPVRVWWDGDAYWLADGFQRVAAAEKAGIKELYAEVLKGTLLDAQWDSYGANGSHGLRRTQQDLMVILQRCLAHPNGAGLSNYQIGKHLNVPESSVRRWRKLLTTQHGVDGTRVAVRNGRTYNIRTTRIGKGICRRNKNETKSRKKLQEELLDMKRQGSPEVGRVLNVVRHWIEGASPSESLKAIERLIKEWKRFD